MMKPVCPKCEVYMERAQCGVFLFEVGVMGCGTAMLADRFACPRCSTNVILETSHEDGGWTMKGGDAKGLLKGEKLKGSVAFTQMVYEKKPEVANDKTE
jgi:hypothetical protein